MKKLTVLFLSLFLASSVFAQRQLSKAAIKDFALSSYSHFKYGNDFAKATFYQLLAGKYQLSDMALIMETLETNKEGREYLLKQMYHRFGGGDNQYLFRQLYSMDISALHANELIAYMKASYGSGSSDKVPVSIKERKTEEIKTYSEEEFSYDYVDTVTVNRNEKFWQGAKSFEGHIDDVYKVVIKGNTIKITEPINIGSVLLIGTIKNGMILKKDGKESKFRYKDHILYYRNKADEWFVMYELAD